jgi:hypothetical protein
MSSASNEPPPVVPAQEANLPVTRNGDFPRGLNFWLVILALGLIMFMTAFEGVSLLKDILLLLAEVKP